MLIWRKRRNSFQLRKQYDATDSSGYELLAWEWVMHCDLKATNVLIKVLDTLSSVQVELWDFCQSKLSCMTLGTTMPLVGTTWWSAPEAFEDENRDKIKISRCVYSLIFFEVLTGKVPFKDIPLRDILQSICDRVGLMFSRCGLLSW